ncbi:hypothetical protein CURTO8I2_280012 [Curtobacterium sp. 8I-2]|nr:hypothetical protein CURTO8I2_280012 [Curtobacterium sp. 8I-2]
MRAHRATKHPSNDAQSVATCARIGRAAVDAPAPRKGGAGRARHGPPVRPRGQIVSDSPGRSTTSDPAGSTASRSRPVCMS